MITLNQADIDAFLDAPERGENSEIFSVAAEGKNAEAPRRIAMTAANDITVKPGILGYNR